MYSTSFFVQYIFNLSKQYLLLSSFSETSERIRHEITINIVLPNNASIHE